MKLYSGSTKVFIKDATQNLVAQKLKCSFFEYFRFNPPQSEIQAWQNSLESLSKVMVDGNLEDTGIILEYQLPLSSKRLDCLICGRDQNSQDNAIVVELKQWSQCKESKCENEVVTWLGGTEREVLHPCVQVEQYKRYLMDVHTVFYEDNPINLDACSYLHNYPFIKTDVIFAKKFNDVISRCPIFTANDTSRLVSFLHRKLNRGKGLDVLQRVEESRYRPSRKLMDHVGNIIKGRSEYILLDEQLVVYDLIFSLAKNCCAPQKIIRAEKC